jgi:hypothetical protein
VTARLTAVVLLGLLLGACFVPRTPDQDGLVGTYVVNGVDPQRLEYSGVFTISAGERGELLVQWIVTGAIQQGTARRSGDTLEVEWQGVEGLGSDATGTARYTINDDGTLVGTRTIDGSDGVGTEEIFPGN